MLEDGGRWEIGWRMMSPRAAVRKDRVLLGTIDRLLGEATTNARTSKNDAAKETLRRLEEILASRLTQARQSGDPFAVQQLVDRMLPLEWGRKALLAESEAALYARPLKKAEPALLSVLGSRDPNLATHATEHLAELFATSAWRTEADALTHRLLMKHPGTPLSDGRTIAAKLAADSTYEERRARLLTTTRDPWPSVFPSVDVDAKRHLDVYQVPILVDAEPGSLLDRLDVYVDRQGRSVRFAGEGHGGTWEVVLPGAPKPLRSGFANLNQVEAFGVGRLLVLRSGLGSLRRAAS